MPNGNEVSQNGSENENEELLREHVDSEHGHHYDEPAQSTTTIVHTAAESSPGEAPSPTVPLAAPAVAPVASPSAQPATSVNTPGLLVLQWLTYAFWGWAAVSLSWLAMVSVSYFINGSRDYESSGSMVAYALAATIVLFLIALVCDVFYTRKEPLHKTGMASAIMVIHAVIFALFGIGWLITAVFGAVRSVIGPENSYSSSDSSTTLVVVGIMMAVIYSVSLLRTLRMVQQRIIPYLYWGVVAITVVVLVSLGIGGPALYANRTKEDRLIEAHLTSVSTAINGYATAHDKLPGSLTAIRADLNEDARRLIDKNLVEYTPGKEVEVLSTVEVPSNLPKTPKDVSLLPYPEKNTNKKSFQYSLCVTFKSAKNAYGRYGKETSQGSADYRPSMPDVYFHEAGRTCYDLQTGASYPYPAY